MRFRLPKITVLVLALAMVPGALEVVENAAHLLTAGHLAHAPAEGDHHPPADPEHGCTPTSHLCGCHANLALVVARAPRRILLPAAGFSGPPAPDLPSPGFRPAVDRPPRV